ncbi:MAG: hypothetical protein KatS3mg005_0414 [Bryobacteraceae bacterium]|nr:MAG: hypothetical protein KatS3mg005_0414 [Bryobacteraceae bacterium]
MLLDTESAGKAREQVRRILGSETFRQAESLRRLLSYLAEKSLAGQAASLKEYIVGVDVFGKPQDYDPQKDASVRIQAGKLRQKLEEYYRKEGLADPVLIEFPKGHFELRFQANKAGRRPGPERRWKQAALLLGALWVVTLAALVMFRAGGLDGLTAEQRALWGPLLNEDRPVLICLGTPLFIKSERGFFRSPRVNRWEETARAPDLEWLMPEIVSGRAAPVHIYTGAGDAMAAAEVARLLTGGGARFLLRRSSALSWDDLAHHNIVFLGPPKYTARINEIPVRMDLVMEGRQIRNLRPRQGEPEVLEGNWPEDSPHVVEDYALISRVPGLHGRTRYLILSASSTEGTAAAAQFVTDAKFAAELVRRVSGGRGRLPEFFQAVIHARFKDMVPVEMSYRFHHELEAQLREAGED